LLLFLKSKNKRPVENHLLGKKIGAYILGKELKILKTLGKKVKKLGKSASYPQKCG